MAGVDPTFTGINGTDPVTYILSANVARRNLTKGQRAMAVATLLVSSNGSQAKGAEDVGVSRQRVTQANVVLDHASDLADAVMAGAMIRKQSLQTHRELGDAIGLSCHMTVLA